MLGIYLSKANFVHILKNEKEKERDNKKKREKKRKRNNKKRENPMNENDRKIMRKNQKVKRK